MGHTGLPLLALSFCPCVGNTSDKTAFEKETSMVCDVCTQGKTRGEVAAGCVTKVTADPVMGWRELTSQTFAGGALGSAPWGEGSCRVASAGPPRAVGLRWPSELSPAGPWCPGPYTPVSMSH